MKKKTPLILDRNHNYTISISDNKGHTLKFRDIRGNDLELLDQIFKYDPSKNKLEDTSISFEDVCCILDTLLVEPSGFKIHSLTKPVINEVFTLVRDNILCNYLPKVIWLKNCYGIQNSSFTNLEQMESVPMSKFVVMVEIHREALDKVDMPNLDVDINEG